MIRTYIYIYVGMHIYIYINVCRTGMYFCYIHMSIHNPTNSYIWSYLYIFVNICIYVYIFVYVYLYIYDTCETASHAFLGNHPELGGGSKSTFTGGIKIHIILMWKPRGLDMFWPIAISPKTLLKRIGSVQKKLVGGKFAQKSGRRLRSWRKFLKRIQALWAAGAPI